MLRLTLLVLVAFVGVSSKVVAEPFRILAWNVESNRPNESPVSDAATIASQLKTLMREPGTTAAIVALSEVAPSTIGPYQQAVADGLSSTVDYVSSASGGFGDSDSLLVIVDRSHFDLVDAVEIHRYAGFVGNFNNADPNKPGYGELRARSPLAAKLKSKSNGQEFWVIVNHLARGEVNLRTEQAKMLRAWAKGHQEPTITCGDFNFDYDFRTKQGNDGFKAMLEGHDWEWLKPVPLVDSNWSQDLKILDRAVDRYPDSLLDFFFVANQAKNWKGKCEVVVRKGDFPDDEKTSDHRPIIADFVP
jgi:hypothetical protein